MFNKKNDKVKKSIDFTKENMDLLDKYKSVYGFSSNNEIINYLINTFLDLEPGIKKSLGEFCNLEYKNLNDELINVEPFERIEKQNFQEQYKNLVRFFTNGNEPLTKNLDNNSMKRIEIEDGYVIIPDDWIVLNENEAKDCRYVGVVEVKNGSDYDAPHFIFFSRNPINELTDIDTDNIDKECCFKFPKYSEILEKKVHLRFDKNRKPINLDEHLKSPIPGYFGIQDQGNGNFYPFGAMIFRYNNNVQK
ncbi:hypothetical protein UT300013_33460 [Paraclostridium sordellii]